NLLVYPASNGYNSYMDRDEGPVGGLEKPPQPSQELSRIVLWMDLLAFGLGFIVSPWFVIGVLIYILASRAYSSRKIRLKQYPILGFLIVIICQGALVFWMVYHGAHENQPLFAPLSGCIASSLLLGGAYPLTQIYQHD